MSEAVTACKPFRAQPARYGALHVVAAACRFGPLVLTMASPARHHSIMHAVIALGGNARSLGLLENSGFILSDGTYADRVRAASVALAAGQIPELNWPPYLYSEDLW